MLLVFRRSEIRRCPMLVIQDALAARADFESGPLFLGISRPICDQFSEKFILVLILAHGSTYGWSQAQKARSMIALKSVLFGSVPNARPLSLANREAQNASDTAGIL